MLILSHKVNAVNSNIQDLIQKIKNKIKIELNLKSQKKFYRIGASLLDLSASPVNQIALFAQFPRFEGTRNP